jgi:radical SAM protein with 4Fe4S-binding SPASM domain
MPCVGVNMPVGNIREKKLKEILADSEVIQNLRDFRYKIKDPCGKCDDADHCYGCRGAAYQLTGDYLAADPLCWKNADHVHEITKLPVAVDDFIPQEGPMRLVDRLMKVGERIVEVETTISPNMPFIDENGFLEEAAYLEIIAQATAAMGGFEQYGSSDKKLEGFLLGVKQFEVLGRSRVGDVLTISVFKYAKYGDFALVQGSICRGSDVLARGEIKTWHNMVEEKSL